MAHPAVPKNFLDKMNLGLLAPLLRSGEATFALALMTILVMLILPIPQGLLDFFLALSLTFSVVILMTVLFLEKPLQFSVFPTVLLVSTMLRLSLNVASTRLILSNGHEGEAAAGQVIKAFGYFIMGGNFFIGLIIFAILVIINFVVITKGSGRIAEVVARFSLDSLPGKQMAVDADLSSGLIEQGEAKKRRKEIQEETNFYGAMDGAAKFVRGDAIAGLLITFINLVGGILIGVLQQKLSFLQAAQAYSVLTVGDGLVTQVPALIISVSAGMLISKASSDSTTNQAMGEQLGAYPIALGMSSALMGILGLLPGVPLVPFFTIGLLMGVVAWRMTVKAATPEQVEAAPSAEPTFEQTLSEVLRIEPVKLELGLSLLHLVKDEAILIAQIRAARQELATQLGVLIPSVRVVDNLELNPQAYAIKIKEIQATSGRLFPDRLFVVNPSGIHVELPGEIGHDPVFGVEGRWIRKVDRARAENLGYLVTEGALLMITHLVETLKDYLPELLSFSMVQQLVDNLSKPLQKVYNDIVPNHLPPAAFQKILQNLLRERVSVRDFGAIVEAIGSGVQNTRNPGLLTEIVRGRLARQICFSLINKQGVLKLISVSGEWEKIFQAALSGGEGDTAHLALSPSQIQSFLDRLSAVYDTPQMRTHRPVPALLATPLMRPHIRGILERFRPQLAVLSHNEFYPKISIEVLDEV